MANENKPHKEDDDQLLFKWKPSGTQQINEDVVYVHNLHVEKEFESLSDIEVEAQIDKGFFA